MLVPLAAKGMRRSWNLGRLIGSKPPSGPWLPFQHPRAGWARAYSRHPAPLPPWEDKLSCQPSPRGPGTCPSRQDWGCPSLAEDLPARSSHPKPRSDPAEPSGLLKAQGAFS